MTADSESVAQTPSTTAIPTTRAHLPHIVLCGVDEAMAVAWLTVAEGRPGVRVHRGSILEAGADAVVSPANSFGWMRGGVDALYAAAWPGIEQQVRSTVLALHGGELPVGEAIMVPTGTVRPSWLISAPTMRQPGQLLPADTVYPYLAARAVFRLWRDGRTEEGRSFRRIATSIALPGLGTGVGGLAPATCARQVAAAWDEVFAPDHSAIA